MVNKITTPPTQNEVISKINELVDDKQDTLVSGTGIDITNNVISAKIATSVSSTSTNEQSVGAKLFYDTVGDIETALHTINSGGEKYIAWVIPDDDIFYQNVILNDNTYWAYTFSPNITDGETLYQLVNNSYNSIGSLKITKEGEYYIEANNRPIIPFMKVNPNTDGSQVYEVSKWTLLFDTIYMSKNPIIGTGFWSNYNNSTLNGLERNYYYYTDGQKHYAKQKSSGELYEITKSGS